ncbi:hypothetical protein CALCODRAFT_459274 [Calocera cornea HHB12733]|uniref:Protein CPL1-like domain-containing protein n=1 Tax=Calocera cornea HHB12733 TaxID=1353952 RepID=A0A165DAK8_9BASI|nr:hypothetical protein CALCODRAFT_459274 [Calocera cornea HHB12733]
MMFAHTLAVLAALTASASVAVAGTLERAAPLADRSVTVCAEGLFWWPIKEVCLTIGGKAAPSWPPAGKECPAEWQYHAGYSCCVPLRPEAPVPRTGDKCANGWPWFQDELCCRAPGPVARPPTPQPSGRGHYARKGKLGRAAKRDHSLRKMDCPAGLRACSIGLHMGEWECIDPLNDLTSCGGCIAPGDIGKDCKTIPGANTVGCTAGACQIFECLAGFELALDGASCVKL